MRNLSSMRVSNRIIPTSELWSHLAAGFEAASGSPKGSLPADSAAGKKIEPAFPAAERGIQTVPERPGLPPAEMFPIYQGLPGAEFLGGLLMLNNLAPQKFDLDRRLGRQVRILVEKCGICRRGSLSMMSLTSSSCRSIRYQSVCCIYRFVQYYTVVTIDNIM